MFCVYILKHQDGYYTGCTSNLDERLRRHNNGWIKSTGDKGKLDLVLTIYFKDKYLAFAFEKYLKSGSGRAFLHKHFVK